MYKEDLFLEGCSRLRIAVSPVQRQAVKAYSEELTLWNKTHALLGPAAFGALEKQFLDSLSSLRLIRESGKDPEKFIDVGSGAGLPGILLSIFLPDAEAVLLERSLKKAGFLRNAAAMAGLRGVDVHDHDLKREEGTYDLVTLRAFSSLESSITDLLRVTKPGGRVVAYKGKREKSVAEIDSLKGIDNIERVELHSLEVPFLPEERTIIMVTKSEAGAD